MNQYTIDSLRKRIQELENEVSIIVDNVIFFRCQISWNFVCMNFPEISVASFNYIQLPAMFCWINSSPNQLLYDSLHPPSIAYHL